MPNLTVKRCQSLQAAGQRYYKKIPIPIAEYNDSIQVLPASTDQSQENHTGEILTKPDHELRMLTCLQ